MRTVLRKVVRFSLFHISLISYRFYCISKSGFQLIVKVTILRFASARLAL